MPSLLIVDDDKTLTTLLEYKFKQLGFDVTIKADGAEAIEVLKAKAVDVLVLDIMMPRIDGFQVLREISSGAMQAPKATLILSARGDERDVLLAFELGALDYVTKPFSVNVLAARIKIALNSKQPVH